MPADASEYIRKLKLATQQNANSAAESRKFRAPTRDTVYDPHRIVKNSIGLEDFKSPVPEHNLFAVKKLTSDRPR